MKFKYLKDYDFSNLLNPTTLEWLKKEEAQLNKTTALVSLYSAYISCTNQNAKNFSLFKIIQAGVLEVHIRCLIGFIYEELHCLNSNKYYYSREIITIFNKLAEELGFCKISIIISLNEVTTDITECLQYYKIQKKDVRRIEYYRGWKIISNDNKEINLNISFIYDAYGKEFTDKLHNSMKSIAKKTITTTLSKKVGFVIAFFRILTKTYPTFESMKKSLSTEFAFESMLVIYNLGLIDTKLNKYDIGHYHGRWCSIVDIYYSLVDYGLWEEPITDIVRPVYKKCNSKNTSTNIIKNENSELIHQKLVTPIPISYTDSEAKELIFQKIINEIKHIVYCSKILADSTLNHYNYFIDMASSGEIKIYSKNIGKHKISVGINNQANTFKTYLSQPFIHENVSNYQNFLGISGNSTDESKEKDGIFNCNYSKLYPLLILLINEHPSITESWLLNWKLNDKNKNMGLFLIGENWYTKSYKKRRGVQNAEQLIKLNENSKQIVKNIITITSIARQFLKSENDPDSDYMLLISRSAFSKPQRVKKIENGTCTTLINSLKKSFEITSYENKKIIIHENETKNIFENLTLTRFRASCAVRVYYETMSVHQMSVALGHKEYNPKLIDSYLPDTLWKFYTNRWIRIFQNALIYESMKKSKFLFQTVDFTKEELDRFIHNHAFKDIPLHIKKGFHEIEVENKINNEQINYIGIFPITVPLLQIFIAIKAFFDNLQTEKSLIKENIKWWYTSASYVINQIEVSSSNLKECVYLTKDIYSMFEIAKKNPIKQSLLKRIILDD